MSPGGDEATLTHTHSDGQMLCRVSLDAVFPAAPQSLLVRWLPRGELELGVFPLTWSPALVLGGTLPPRVSSYPLGLGFCILEFSLSSDGPVLRPSCLCMGRGSQSPSQPHYGQPRFSTSGMCEHLP